VTEPDLRRASDGRQLRRTVFGGAIVVFAIVLKFVQPAVTDWLLLALVGIGAGLVSPTFIVDLVRSWRANGAPKEPHGPE
jgi:hypothetical protein